MSDDSLDDILDNLFHGCAFAAFIEQSALEGGPHDMEATRTSFGLSSAENGSWCRPVLSPFSHFPLLSAPWPELAS